MAPAPVSSAAARLLVVLFAVVMLFGCNARLNSLQASLPRQAAGLTFDQVRVVEESQFLDGHPIDDAYREVGKRRSDATAVFLHPSNGAAEIGAVTVSGVSGDSLLRAVVDAWSAPAVVARSERAIGDRAVWGLETRSGHVTAVYRRDDVVYIVSSSDRALVDAIMLEMP
jgi:hypothetical protein